MTDQHLDAIYTALNRSDRREAKRLLVPLLKSHPDADAYYYAAYIAGDRKQARAFLRRALQEDAFHSGANRLLMRIEEQGMEAIKTTPLAPPGGRKRATTSQPVVNREAMQQKQRRIRRRQRQRGVLVIFGVASFLLSITLSYVTMLALGVGTVIVNPVAETLGGEAPIMDYNGTPIADVDNPAALLDLPASLSTELPLGAANATGDILRNGLLHEYKFRARVGGNIAVAVQFFSPLAEDVFPNVAIIDPNGELAGDRCRREIIIDAQTGAAFICAIDVSGEWQVRIFGKDGESSGAYVVTAEGIID